MLDEEQLRGIEWGLNHLKALDARRETVLASIREQGLLSDKLRQEMMQADTLTRLEDLYQPFKPKRRTRASVAREKGLQGLADLVLAQDRSHESVVVLAQRYLNGQVATIEEALAGARDIAAETISDHPDVRRHTRDKGLQWGEIYVQKATAAVDDRRVFELYYDTRMRVDRIKPHQMLAVNRGVAEKVLRVKVEIAERDWLEAIQYYFRPDRRSPFAEQLAMAIADSAERLLLPAIERDILRTLTLEAQSHAIKVFAGNLRALLSQAPLTGHVVIGIDPGFRNGCKLAVVDVTGKVLDTETISPHKPQKRWEESLQTLFCPGEQTQAPLLVDRETEQPPEKKKMPVAQFINRLPNHLG